MRMETLLGPHSLERYRKVCFAFGDEQRELFVGQLRLTLQLEDHLDWLLRKRYVPASIVAPGFAAGGRAGDQPADCRLVAGPGGLPGP
ncbi:MAG: hypothetical protein IPP88_15570 [Betaproteobacteria bacterium]|nr:hypothetical protein [Betaproteobacteria bacterium]